MLTRHRWAVLAACSLPLLLTGCVATAPDATTVAAIATPGPTPNAAHPSAARPAAADAAADAVPLPAANPVEVRVTGTVLTRAGGPMLGATVSVRPASASRDCLNCSSARTRTDAKGRFVLTLARGDYLIRCQLADGSLCRIEDETAPQHLSVHLGSPDVMLIGEGPR